MLGEEAKETLRKEVVDVKRALAEEAQEKDLVQRTAAELRATIKREEAEKTELNRVIQEDKNRIGGM